MVSHNGADIQALRGISEYLLHRKGNHETSEYEDEVVNWINQLGRNLKDDNVLNVRSGSTGSVVAQILLLLRDCLLTHRWEDVVKAICVLIKEPTDTVPVTWKTGLEVLYQNYKGNSFLIDNLKRQIIHLPDVNVKEVILEYIMFLLLTNRVDDATFTSQSIPRFHGLDKKETARSKYIDVLFEAYTGFLWYVNWVINKEKFQELEKELAGNPLLQCSSNVGSLEQVMQSSQVKAVECFKNLHEKYGIWDIFIKKHVELLDYYNNQEEAIVVLKKYKEKNSENPNAHKYLYTFLVGHNGSVEEKIAVLEDLIRQVPSDELAFDLCDLYMKDCRHSKVVRVLFNLLDYSCWESDSRPWKLLSETLRILYNCSPSDAELFEVTKECWNIRKSWWPPYHFSNMKYEQHLKRTETEVIKAKCGICIQLVDSENIFCQSSETEDRRSIWDLHSTIT